MMLKNLIIKLYSGNIANINVVYIGTADDIYLTAPPGLFCDKTPLIIKIRIKILLCKKINFNF